MELPRLRTYGVAFICVLYLYEREAFSYAFHV